MIFTETDIHTYILYGKSVIQERSDNLSLLSLTLNVSWHAGLEVQMEFLPRLIALVRL